MRATLQARRLLRRVSLGSALGLCGATLVLTGCATGTTAYGNYAAGSASFNQKLASDAIKQLVALYPPASTRFNIAQSTPDPFGTALVAGLRGKGYAVRESNPVGATQPAAPSDKTASSPETGVGGLDLRYLVDQQGTGNLYRLTLAIGSQSLTRAYVAQNDSAQAAGSWVRKE